MALLNNSEVEVTEVAGDEVVKDRFLLGSTGCYFEVAKKYSGNKNINPEKVRSLGNNPAMKLADTKGKGRSLKVLFTTEAGEVRFLGFVTAGDASLELDVAEHGEQILEAWQDDKELIIKAATNDELIGEW